MYLSVAPRRTLQSDAAPEDRKPKPSLGFSVDAAAEGSSLEKEAQTERLSD